jgi:peptidoglycan/LPS O-acetylase OafA/YrhL
MSLQVERKSAKTLPGLNGLRFIAAGLVLLEHCHQECYKIGIIGAVSRVVIFSRGLQAVDFFFTLSGFLITYLLLQEFQATETVSLKKFYMRRACRIWPLYYIILGCGIFLLGVVYPHRYHERYFDFSLGPGLLMYIFFLPNWMAAYHKVGLLLPLWSIGVEEQFYAFWAPLVKRFGRSAFALVTVFLAVTLVMAVLMRSAVFSNGEGPRAFFLERLRFHYMAVGCFFSCLLFHKGSWLRESVFVQKWFCYFTVSALAYHYIIGFRARGAIPSTALDLGLAVLYGSLIIQVSVAGKGLSFLEWKPVSHLGKISYGIYMYHMLLAYLARTTIDAIHPQGTSVGLTVTFFVAVFVLTILVAQLSYKYVESYFLSIGHRRYSAKPESA